MIRLAFYIGAGRVDDRVIRWVTRSPFSHVELVAPDGRAISSSGRDGGVRWADIDFRSGRWTLVAVPWAPADTLERIAEHLGARYDFAGLLGAQVVNLRRGDPRRWFCSEICAHALGMASPSRYAPGDLYTATMERNAIFELDRSRAGKPPEESRGLG